MKTFIFIRTQFPAIHNWPEASSKCPASSFLSHPHRHMFHVVIKVAVAHTDRDVEFIEFKDAVNSYIRKHMWNYDLGRMSCEDIALSIVSAATGIIGREPFSVEVSEDGENGAIVELP